MQERPTTSSRLCDAIASGTLSKKFAVQGRIIHALILRELMTRFGRENIGFFWLVMEPLILTCGVALLWTIRYGNYQHGVSLIGFVLTGYSMLVLWRHLIGRSINSFRHNAGLLFHSNVKLADTYLARAVLETMGAFIALLVAYVPLVVFEVVEPIHDWFLVLSGWFLLAWLAFGLGMILASVSLQSDLADRLNQPIQYLSLPLTGTFFMVSWLPNDYHDVILYAPMINATEMMRAGFMPEGTQTYWHADYLIFCCLILNLFGVLLMRRAMGRLSIEN